MLVRVTQRPGATPEAKVHVEHWSAEKKEMRITARQPVRLALRLLNYPAWRVEVNGRQVQAGMREGTGQMLVPVEAGANRVQITFIRTWDRTAGAWISLLATLLALGFLRKPLAPSSSARTLSLNS